MKGIMNLIVTGILLAIPITSECQTVAFSPSIPGQPLVFHMNTTFNQMQPSQFSAVTWTQLENALLIRSSYTKYLDTFTNRKCCAQCNFWADGMGQWQHQNAGHKHQFGYNDITGGLTLGADSCFNNFLVGIAASYTHSKLRWKKSSGSSQINSYYGGLYGSWDNGCFYIDAAVLGAFSNYHTSRHFHYRTMDRSAHADHNGWEALTGFEIGTMLQKLFCDIDFIPFLGVDYVYLSQQGYNEYDADRFNLHIKKRNDQLVQSELGFQFTHRMLCDYCYTSWILAPSLALSYINQTSLTGRTYHANFISRNHEFSVNGWDFNRNLGAVALSFNLLDCTETIKFTLSYDGQFGKNYWNQTGSIICNFCF